MPPMNQLINKTLPAILLAAVSWRSMAQQPTTPVTPAAQTGPVALDGIVAVVGDQPITRYFTKPSGASPIFSTLMPAGW